MATVEAAAREVVAAVTAAAKAPSSLRSAEQPVDSGTQQAEAAPSSGRADCRRKRLRGPGSRYAVRALYDLSV